MMTFQCLLLTLSIPWTHIPGCAYLHYIYDVKPRVISNVITQVQIWTYRRSLAVPHAGTFTAAQTEISNQNWDGGSINTTEGIVRLVTDCFNTKATITMMVTSSCH